MPGDNRRIAHTETLTMPTWCNNLLFVTGPQEELEKFVSIADARSYRDSFLMAFDPPPREATLTNEALLDWCGEHWGTRYDDPGSIKMSCARGQFRCEFETGSAPAQQWVERMSRAYPTLCLTLHFLHPAGEMCGSHTCCNGGVIATIDTEDASLAKHYGLTHFNLDPTIHEWLLIYDKPAPSPMEPRAIPRKRKKAPSAKGHNVEQLLLAREAVVSPFQR